MFLELCRWDMNEVMVRRENQAKVFEQAVNVFKCILCCEI